MIRTKSQAKIRANGCASYTFRGMRLTSRWIPVREELADLADKNPRVEVTRGGPAVQVQGEDEVKPAPPVPEVKKEPEPESAPAKPPLPEVKKGYDPESQAPPGAITTVSLGSDGGGKVSPADIGPAESTPTKDVAVKTSKTTATRRTRKSGSSKKKD